MIRTNHIPTYTLAQGEALAELDTIQQKGEKDTIQQKGVRYHPAERRESPKPPKLICCQSSRLGVQTVNSVFI